VRHRAPRRVATALLLLLVALAVAGARPAKPRPPSSPGSRIAPPIELSSWINTKPLKRADLAGKVRLVEFWAFGCINCQNTVMAMRELNAMYAKRGLLVVGVHTPESQRERDSVAVAAAVTKYGIGFPVALDNDSKVFKAFKNRYWPALYLIDRKGIVVATHIGELHVGTRAWRNLCDAVESALSGKEPQRS